MTDKVINSYDLTDIFKSFIILMLEVWKLHGECQTNSLIQLAYKTPGKGGSSNRKLAPVVRAF